MKTSELLPLLDSLCNLSSLILVIVGLLAVKFNNLLVHKSCMIGAYFFSMAFLGIYLYYHFNYVPREYSGDLSMWAYYLILISHILLAIVLVPLSTASIYWGQKGEIENHKKWAKWTAVIWPYVSFTGLVIYYLIYL